MSSAEHLSHLAATDPVVRDLILAEEEREYDVLRLIPSENYVSAAVLEATGSIFTNKYSEGYPGKRYYEGQQIVDQIENLAMERAKKLFGVDHANVQPYSGSPANMAVYHALLEPGDTIMGLALPQGGHLTHGWKMNFSGKLYHAVSYDLHPETEQLDYDAIWKQAREAKPKLIVAGFTAYPRTIDFGRFREICDDVGAYFHADISHIAGLIAGGAHPSPFPLADTGITTTHKSLRGPRGAMILCREQYAQAIDKAIMPGLQGGPHNHTTAAIAVALEEAMQPDFRAYAQQVVANAKALAERLLTNGFRLISGGTDNHLILMETQKSKGLNGRDAARALDAAGIVTNRNTVPFDTNPPLKPSGVRMGTPAITSRGMTEEDMPRIGDWIRDALARHDDDAALATIKEEVREFCSAFPCPGIENRTHG